MRKWFCACVVLLLVVGVTQAGDDGGKKADPQPQFASGVLKSLEVKDGVGTLTVLVLKSKQGNDVKFADMKFAITKDTKFYWGGKIGPDGRPSKQGNAVHVDDVAAGLRKYSQMWVFFTGEGDNMTATMVDGHP